MSTQKSDPATTRTLHFYRSPTPGRILDTNKQTILYTYRLRKMAAPHISLFSPNETLLATATSPCFTPSIHATLHNQKLPLKRNGFLRTGHRFRSPSTGRMLKWKQAGCSGYDLVLYDENGGVLARYERSTFAVHKEGKLVLMGLCAQGGVLMDEVVLTALAELENAYGRKKVVLWGDRGGG